MKKIYFLLAMICSICAFTACSDDDEKTPTCPVTDYSVPAKATAGSSISISGKGFAEGARIILMNAQNQETPAENISVSASAVTLTIPAGLPAGSYKVILRQSGDWELGTITVEAVAGPIEGLVIPENGVAGEDITLEGKGFDENTKIYLETDDLTTEALTIKNVAENGLTLTIPVILPAGPYRVMLDQEGGIQLGSITISEKPTPVLVSRIVKVSNYGNESIIFTYNAGRISSIKFKTSYFDETEEGEEVEVEEETGTYEITYLTETSIVAKYSPFYEGEGDPIEWEYTLSAGKVVSALKKTQVMQYDDEGIETGTIDKIHEYTYEYTPDNYLKQISEKPNDASYDTLYFQYNSGNVSELNYGSMILIPDATGKPSGEVEHMSETFTFDYNNLANNTKNFDLMSIVLYKIKGDDNLRLIQLLGIGGKYPSQLPGSYTSAGGDFPIEYSVTNDFVTKIEFPDDVLGEPDIFRIEYQ